jgi:NAD(P)-dependent dehydrogenase (short-subunit alcohol dehydrogenase family)
VKTAIVTGATKGIGEAAALALADAGWWVLASGREDTAGKALQEELERRSGGLYQGGDLTEEGVPEKLVGRAVEETGRLDALVNNAGVHHVAAVADTDPAVYDRLMDVNLRAAFLLARAAIPPMREQGGGTIVNVSSEAGLIGFPGQMAYNISKAGLVMLTKSIVADYSADGIRAVTVCPGTTLTPLVQKIIDEAPDPKARARELASIRPANRLGRPEEIAAAIVFAVSDEAAFMTGSELVMDGGNVSVT